MLVAMALPKGLPEDPKTNQLAIRTEDHPFDYATSQEIAMPARGSRERVVIVRAGFAGFHAARTLVRLTCLMRT
ncbi:hypothetical protein GCM10023191_086110 [Actinoallomurus oryzae]|uniref:DNA ligase D 3'-phosphoesterase domain-containing protein n=1 Tax=Actinoallomurus oryzae TaxID=502180 RepID=A0ABP8R1L1_9ACTN